MQSLAKIVLEGNCLNPNKAAFCDGMCKVHDTGSDDWYLCLEECEKDSQTKATAIVESIAQIDVYNSVGCDGYSGTDGRVGEVYVTILSNETTPDISAPPARPTY